MPGVDGGKLTSAGSHVGQSLSLGDVGGRNHRRHDRDGLADDSGGSQFARNSSRAGHDRGRSFGAGNYVLVSQLNTQSNDLTSTYRRKSW